MALRQVATCLGQWNARLGSMGSMSQLPNGLGASLQQERDEQDASSQAQGFGNTARLHTLVAEHLMLPAAQSTSSPFIRQFSTALGLGKRSASVGLLGRKTVAGLGATQPLPFAMQGMHQQQQQRNLNAWSPAQRYFVEGEHVITAEANRAIQFTGLDAGSFYPFLVYTAFATAVAAVFVVVPFLVAPSRVDLDKSSAYECGFDAFGEARQTFNVSFYLVSIMYLLFDIEIAYLFPYVMTHASTPMFWTMNLFLSILVAGFVYEWGVGALEWRESKDTH